MTPTQNPELAIGSTEIIGGLVILLLLVAYLALPAILAYVVLSRVPPEHRKQQPRMAFLLLIPLFSVVWAFFVHPKVAASLRSYYDARGTRRNRDCGESSAMWLCICSACSFVPIVGALPFLASIALLFVFYTKALDLSSTIQQAAEPGATDNPVSAPRI